MASVGMFTIGTNWTKLSDLFTVEEDTTYLFFNRGSGNLLVYESDTLPTEPDLGFIMHPNKESCEYKKGSQDSYIRAVDTKTRIYVSSGD